jgi:hypothetical protein
MKLFEAQRSLLVTPGTYPATINLAQCAPGKKDPSSTNINITLDLILPSGRTARVWDLLPDIDKNPKVFFRYDQYIQALDLELPADFDLTARSFAAELNKAANDAIGIKVTVSIEESPGYPSRNAVKRVEAMDIDMIQHVARAQRHDSDTDGAAQPSANCAVGSQAPASEDQNLV